MQELVRAVRSLLGGAEHAADHHLRLGEALAQHAHQRNRAALADVAAGRAEVRLAGGVQALSNQGAVAGAFQPLAPLALCQVTLAW
jgi:hypothetical protein